MSASLIAAIHDALLRRARRRRALKRGLRMRAAWRWGREHPL